VSYWQFKPNPWKFKVFILLIVSLQHSPPHPPDVVMSKSATVSITFEVGKVMLVDLPDYFEAGSMINGKASKCIFLVAEAFTFLNLDHSQQISVSRFNGTPIANKVVYLLDGNSWPNKLLQNLTTNQKGLATFSLNTANLPKAALNLVV